jgi:hypothetical protein
MIDIKIIRQWTIGHHHNQSGLLYDRSLDLEHVPEPGMKTLYIFPIGSNKDQVAQHHPTITTLIFSPNMITSVAHSLARSILSRTIPVHLYASIHKFTQHVLPPIIIYWTEYPKPGIGTHGYINALSLPKLAKGHRVYLEGYKTGRIASIRETTDPELVQVHIICQIHRLGYHHFFLLMPAHLAGY